MFSMYNESLAVAIRGGAPLASCSIDRRCLRQRTEAQASDDLATLVCLSCSWRFLFVATRKHHGVVWWKHLQAPDGTVSAFVLSSDRKET